MCTRKLLIYAVAGVALFLLGFTSAAFWYEPAIDVLGVIVQFLLVFVGLLGIDEWHRQFKFKRKWERLERKINSLNGVLLSIDSIADSLLAYQACVDTSERLKHRELAISVLGSASDQSRHVMKILNTYGQTINESPTNEEFSQLTRYTKIECRLLHDLSEDAFEKKTLLSTGKNKGACLVPGENALHHQIALVKLINKYGIERGNWTLRYWANKEISRSKAALKRLER